MKILSIFWVLFLFLIVSSENKLSLGKIRRKSSYGVKKGFKN